MPEITVSEETRERPDAMRDDEVSHDELVTELIDICEAEEPTMSFGGDRLP
jgi:hypothetical protein